jgi:hypothetical protein
MANNSNATPKPDRARYEKVNLKGSDSSSSDLINTLFITSRLAGTEMQIRITGR